MNLVKNLSLVIFIILTFYTTHKIKKEVLSEKEYSEEVGKIAPDFNLKNIEDKEISLKNLRGKAVILIFFATWCGPCKTELETLKEEENFIHYYNVKLILISTEEKEKVKKFLEENGFDFDVLLDPDEKIIKLYNVKAIPKTIIIDDKGKIIFSKIGAINSAYIITSKLKYSLNLPDKEKKFHKEVDKVIDSILCTCNCGKSILKCDCKNCNFIKRREDMRYYISRLLGKERFKEEQVIQIVKWKYIENLEEKNAGNKD